MASERDKQLAAEVLVFVVEFQSIFTATEISNYLDHLVRTKDLARLIGSGDQ